MRVAIFSDLHDHLNNLETFLNWVNNNKVSKLIFCGDLCNKEILKYLTSNFSGEIFLVGGNADLFLPKDTKDKKNLVYDEHKLEFKLDQQKILVAHKPADLKKYLSEDNSFDFAFHGHTHKPWMAKEGGVIIANPGTLGSTSGPVASFAIMETDTGQLELKVLGSI